MPHPFDELQFKGTVILRYNLLQLESSNFFSYLKQDFNLAELTVKKRELKIEKLLMQSTLSIYKQHYNKCCSLGQVIISTEKSAISHNITASVMAAEPSR